MGLCAKGIGYPNYVQPPAYTPQSVKNLRKILLIERFGGVLVGTRFPLGAYRGHLVGHKGLSTSNNVTNNLIGGMNVTPYIFRIETLTLKMYQVMLYFINDRGEISNFKGEEIYYVLGIL